jgi:hypothetical protein
MGQEIDSSKRPDRWALVRALASPDCTFLIHSYGGMMCVRSIGIQLQTQDGNSFYKLLCHYGLCLVESTPNRAEQAAKH